MKIKELIAILQTGDPEKLVFIEHVDTHHARATGCIEVYHEGNFDVGFDDQGDANITFEKL